MALKVDESGTAGAHRVLRKQIADALESLSHARLTDGDVHEARKQLKKARATLRLLRVAIGTRKYKQANITLRDAARPLGVSRDASVLPDALEKLISRYGSAGRALPVTALRRQLLADRAQARKQLSQARVRRISTDLRALERHIKSWRIDDADWKVLGEGFSRTYRKGRKALTAARSRKTEDLHEWRKQVKYLRYQLQLLEPLWPGVVGELTDQAHKLMDYLGDDHDLAVLDQRIRRDDRSLTDSAARGALLALIARCRLQLQDKALILGTRLYEEPPGALRDRFGKYWEVWRSTRRPMDLRRASA